MECFGLVKHLLEANIRTLSNLKNGCDRRKVLPRNGCHYQQLQVLAPFLTVVHIWMFY